MPTVEPLPLPPLPPLVPVDDEREGMLEGGIRDGTLERISTRLRAIEDWS
jgi:hypothetical protein